MAAKKKPAANGKNTKNIAAKQAQMVKSMESASAWQTVTPFVLGFLAILFLLCFVLPENTGAVGPFVSSALRGLFSVGAYAVPLLLLNIAVFWRRDAANGIRGAKALFSFLFLLFFSAFFGLFAPRELVSSFSPELLYQQGVAHIGGGLLGSLLANALIAVMDRIASGILFGFGLLLCLSFLCGKTPAELCRLLAGSVKQRRENAKRYRDEHAADEGEVFATPVPVDAHGLPADITQTTVPFLPDEDPLYDEAADPDVDDVTKLNPRAATGNTMAEKIAGVFSDQSDPALKQKLQQGEVLLDGDDAQAELHSEKRDLSPTQEKRAKNTYRYPPLSLLSAEKVRKTGNEKECRQTAEKLVSTLRTFNVNTTLSGISQGPCVTRYELQPETGVRVKSIVNLADDIALNLAAKSIRIEAPIPGREAVGIEIPNKSVSTVYIRELMENPAFRQSRSTLLACLGMDVAGESVFCDLTKMPHLLIAGATNMGKSVCINSFITSILYKSTPDEVRLILIDPKKVEMNMYKGISHLLVPVVSDPKKAAGALCWAVGEMERRFALIEEQGVRNIQSYNEAAENDPEIEPFPRIVIIIDELADLMMTARDEVESSICRLAQKARAAGIHLLIGTQRPSVDVITGLIKANFPSRIAFTVASQIDSRTVLDMAGAERLLGRGDMLYSPVGATKPIRVQGAFVSEGEVEAIVSFLKREKEAEYSEETIADIEKEAARCGEKRRGGEAGEAGEAYELDADNLLYKAIELAVDNGSVATSLLQRRLSVGYARAARLIDTMEQRGIVGPFNGSKPRDVLITREEFLEMMAKKAPLN